MMRLLYVEDNPNDAELARLELGQVAPEISLTVATSRQQALARLEAEPHGFDLVLTDIHLPDGDGLSLLAKIREHGWPVGVVIVTGGGNEETAVAALKAGANDYLVKRADYLTQLPQTLAAALARFRAEQARHTRPLRVLYAEDNAADVNLTRRHLARHARHVHLDVVYTAPAVLQRLPAAESVSDHDVLLLDYSLPGQNALDLLREIHLVRRLDIPVVVVTGQGDEELALEVLRLGATDYVVKNPGYLYKLPSVLENAFHRAQLLREQAALRQSEARYRRLVEQTPAVTYTAALDPEATPTYVSPQVAKILGLSPAEYMASPTAWQQPVHPEDREHLMAAFRHTCATGEPLVCEYRWLGRGGQEAWLRNEASVVHTPDGRLLFIQGLIVDITERKQATAERERLHQEVQAANARLQALNLRLLEVQETERRHLARELHDEIGQQLTGLKLLLDMNALVPGKPPRASLAEAQGLAQELMSQVRELSLTLRPAMLDDLGLLPALLWHLDRYSAQTGVKVHLRHRGLEGQRFDNRVETAAYRIVQEALTNVARYSGVHEAEVQLARGDEQLHLEVSDAGAGFDPRTVLAAGRSNGLAGMSERASLLGGEFAVESSPGAGTRLMATLPLVVNPAPGTPNTHVDSGRTE